MNIDFLDAHRRHWKDAEMLFASARWANADHLYGLAAECGLKRLMMAFGMPVTSGGDPQHRNDRVHADQVWDRYETYRSGHGSGSGYALPQPNPFGNWHVSQRYAAQANFSHSLVSAHRNGANLVRELTCLLQAGQECSGRWLNMTTFDQIVPALAEMLRDQHEALSAMGPLIINRDLNGRVRLVVSEKVQSNPDLMEHIYVLTHRMAERLGRHAFPPDRAVLFDAQIDAIRQELPGLTLEGLNNIWIVDRLVTESNWSAISPVAEGVPRVVFFSLKGGVGRSTAMAVSAWALAQQGYRVLALNLDLESPGFSSALLPEDRLPEYGITDWLVEDLVDNGKEVFEGMVAISSLSREGEIYVVPAHGRDPGEYIPKLGRIWMPRVDPEGRREIWSLRLRRLIDHLEQRYNPDVILIDARAGIDEVASACITDLGAHLALLPACCRQVRS